MFRLVSLLLFTLSYFTPSYVSTMQVPKELALSEYGLSDNNFDTAHKREKLVKDDDGVFFLKGLDRACGNETWFGAGAFESMSINSLRRKTKDVVVSKHGKAGKFHLLIGDKPWANNAVNKKLDIGAMLADPAYEGATFQVASNFNALEGSSVSCMPLVEEYVYDNTQGPRASISCLAATLLRKYYAFYKDDTAPENWSQELGKREVSFLQEASDAIKTKTGLELPVANGYLDVSSFSKKQRKIIDDHLNLENIHVGLHQNAEVMWGYNWTGDLEKEGLWVNQVFTAALDLGMASGSENYLVAHDESVKNIARKLLFAAYEGTIRAAIIAGSQKVVLTLVGGGVFNNNPQEIVDAICANEKTIRTSGIQVQLVVYDKSSFDAGALEHLKTFSSKMGGTVTQY